MRSAPRSGTNTGRCLAPRLCGVRTQGGHARPLTASCTLPRARGQRAKRPRHILQPSPWLRQHVDHEHRRQEVPPAHHWLKRLHQHSKARHRRCVPTASPGGRPQITLGRIGQIRAATPLCLRALPHALQAPPAPAPRPSPTRPSNRSFPRGAGVWRGRRHAACGDQQRWPPPSLYCSPKPRPAANRHTSRRLRSSRNLLPVRSRNSAPPLSPRHPPSSRQTSAPLPRLRP
mmetsp:Transcript_82742/g.230739  ORF Transcript_82742/g.230739 Transcript_82742/m.230739 type:complete len:231 (-) Transcript_82742:1041-1733(-)